MNDLGHLIYVVATRPYAEKVIENKFFFDRSSAEDKQSKVNSYFNRLTGENEEPYKVYEARLVIMEKEV